MNVAFPALLAQSSLIFMVELKQKIEDAYNCSFLNCLKILSKSMNLLNKWALPLMIAFLLFEDILLRIFLFFLPKNSKIYK